MSGAMWRVVRLCGVCRLPRNEDLDDRIVLEMRTLKTEFTSE